jgi:hypothetical protein
MSDDVPESPPAIRIVQPEDEYRRRVRADERRAALMITVAIFVGLGIAALVVWGLFFVPAVSG